MNKPVNWDKPIEWCSEGRWLPARLISKDGPENYPYVVVRRHHNGDESVATYGEHTVKQVFRNIVAKKTAWVNIYKADLPFEVGVAYRTEEYADTFANKDRVACIPVEYEE